MEIEIRITASRARATRASPSVFSLIKEIKCGRVRLGFLLCALIRACLWEINQARAVQAERLVRSHERRSSIGAEPTDTFESFCSSRRDSEETLGDGETAATSPGFHRRSLNAVRTRTGY